MNPQRAEAVRRLDSIITGLLSQAHQARQLRDFLMGSEVKVPALYDLPAEDAEDIARRYGLPPRESAEGDAPEWFEQRLREISAARDTDAPPSGGSSGADGAR